MNSEKTAIARTKVSAPTQWLLDNDKLDGNVLHFGEGKAFQDTAAIQNAPNVDMVVAYDPNSYNPLKRQLPDEVFNYVVCNYVLNVLTENERHPALCDAYTHASTLYVTVRLDKVKGEPYQDGVITSKGTFQAQLTAAEWALWIINSLYAQLGYMPSVMVLHGTRNYLMFEVS